MAAGGDRGQKQETHSLAETVHYTLRKDQEEASSSINKEHEQTMHEEQQ
jgi:hypothetical protein